MASHASTLFAIEHANMSFLESLVHENCTYNDEDENNSNSHAGQVVQTRQQYSLIFYLREDLQMSVAQFNAPQLNKRCNDLVTLFNLCLVLITNQTIPTHIFLCVTHHQFFSTYFNEWS